MTLNELQLSYIKCASGLGDYQSISKMELGNGYCDAEEAGDEVKRSQYFSAIMLRYWYKIFAWMKDSASCKLQPEDFVAWLEHVLWVVFYYRAWRYEYKAVVKDGKFIDWEYDENGERIPNEHYWMVDPNAFDRTVNFFAAAQRGKEYQYLNKDKHKAHIYSNSLDVAVEDIGDAALEEAGAVEEFDKFEGVRNLVQLFIKQGRSIEAFIVDGIAYQHAFKEDKERIDRERPDYLEEDEEWDDSPIYKYHYTFNERLLVKHLTTIDEDFMKGYFEPFYDVSEEQATEMYTKLKETKNAKLYKYIKKTFENIRTEPALLSCIMPS